MKLKNWIRAQLVLQTVALQAGKTPAEVRRDMQEVIDLAWSEPSAEAAAMQRWRFPAGKPTVEEFVVMLANQI